MFNSASTNCTHKFKYTHKVHLITGQYSCNVETVHGPRCILTSFCFELVTDESVCLVFLPCYLQTHMLYIDVKREMEKELRVYIHVRGLGTVAL